MTKFGPPHLRFDDAVAVHRIMAAIEDSATQDRRVPVG